MTQAAFAAEFAQYGPDWRGSCTVAEANAYCRRLASRQYENFTKATWLIPRELRPHFLHLYAYCRWADDLADEAPDAAEAQRRLAWWAEELDACFRGSPRHPVFVAAAGTIERFDLPRGPFEDLLSAFRQDQTKTRYADFAELQDYCRRSANPVGRLVLRLGKCTDAEAFALSDSICTGLQLANFCQDVAADYRRGRIYLPADARAAAGCDEAEFAAGRASEAFRRLLAAEVDRAEAVLIAGRPLIARVPPWLACDVHCFLEGGRAALRAVRRVGYNVWTGRPRVSRSAKASILVGGVLRRLVGRNSRE